MASTLSHRLADALGYAVDLFGSKSRKESRALVLSHPLIVSGLVLEHGGDEDEAIAALLHDAVEDAGGLPTLEEIRRRFGSRVAEIVLDCSDSTAPDPDSKEVWRPRKERYIAHLVEVSASAILVSVADKVHNSEVMLSDFRAVGSALWDRFKDPISGQENPDPALRQAKREAQLWYFGALLSAYRRRGDKRCGSLVDRLANTVATLRKETEATLDHESR